MRWTEPLVAVPALALVLVVAQSAYVGEKPGLGAQIMVVLFLGVPAFLASLVCLIWYVVWQKCNRVAVIFFGTLLIASALACIYIDDVQNIHLWQR